MGGDCCARSGQPATTATNNNRHTLIIPGLEHAGLTPERIIPVKPPSLLRCGKRFGQHPTRLETLDELVPAVARICSFRKMENISGRAVRSAVYRRALHRKARNQCTLTRAYHFSREPVVFHVAT
jgi:hypothetical protein